MTGRKRKARQVSLAEVAEAAKVSMSTVSKVANNSPHVAEATRQRVSETLEAMGYLSTRERRPRYAVALMLRDVASPFTLDVIRGVVGRSQQLGCEVFLETLPAASDDLRWIDQLASTGRRAALAISSTLTDAQFDRFAAHGMPVVIIDVHSTTATKAHSINATNWRGAFSVTEHLLELGHRELAMVSGSATGLVSRARISGFTAALEGYGLERQDADVVHGVYSFESGLALGTELLSRDRPPTAIVAASDFQAIGVIDAARRLRLRVPEDVSVVGFDDLVIARNCAPLLTTVRQPLEEMGAAGVETAVALLAGEDTKPQNIEIATELVIRDSTAAPRKR